MADRAVKRATAELAKAKAAPTPGISVDVDPSNVLIWKVVLDGPAGSPYAGGKFHLNVAFPQNYPFSPPVLTFTHPIYHPNIKKDGSHICTDGLEETDWKPANKAFDLVKIVADLLVKPNPDHPVETDIAIEYTSDRSKFDKNAAECTRKYAH